MRILVLATGLVLVVIALVPRLGATRLPGNNQGYSPVQPIAYSHRLHAGELGMQCLYCHFGAERSRRAGIPAASICMNCHRFVTAPITVLRDEDERAKKEERKPERIVSDELAKLYAALGLDDEMQRDPKLPVTPIRWVRVHKLPDFVSFDHRSHITAGLTCQRCHGPVETMERMRQENDLSMGWCIDCHRSEQASTDCSTCHY